MLFDWINGYLGGLVFFALMTAQVFGVIAVHNFHKKQRPPEEQSQQSRSRFSLWRQSDRVSDSFAQRLLLKRFPQNREI